ncbi:MAG: hypothetical protein ACT4OV_00390, partial [Microthrixaceae bacterium]
PVEHEAVAHALDRLRGDQPAPRAIASSEALALADELDALEAELGPQPWASAGEAGLLAAARSRLDDARQTLLEAEQAVRTPVLQAEDVARLEAVHAELSDAIDKADGRFARARARSRVAELRVAEQEVLDELGFSSYAAYVMGYSLFTPSAEAEAAVVAARTELATAEREWTRLERETGTALARAATLDRRRLLLERARAMLDTVPASGPPQPALRALRLPAVSEKEAQDILESALEQMGLAISEERLERDELVLIAESWLAEVTLVDDRRKALLQEQAAVESAHAALLREVAGEEPDDAALEVSPDAPGAVPVDRDTVLLPLREALAEAERCVADRDRLAVHRASLVADLATATEMEATARTAAADLDRDLAAAVLAETALEERRRALQRDLRHAEEALAEIDHAIGTLPGPTVHLEALDAAIEEAVLAHEAAIADEERADRALDLLDAEGRATAVEIERLQDIVAAKGTGSASHADELEWYLLARLASQRAVSVAGSLPILLDDALRGLGTREVTHLLGRLERMAEAVQVILVSEDPVAAAWAADAGPARAAVVSPAPA